MLLLPLQLRHLCWQLLSSMKPNDTKIKTRATSLVTSMVVVVVAVVGVVVVYPRMFCLYLVLSDEHKIRCSEAYGYAS